MHFAPGAMDVVESKWNPAPPNHGLQRPRTSSDCVFLATPSTTTACAAGARRGDEGLPEVFQKRRRLSPAAGGSVGEQEARVRDTTCCLGLGTAL